MQTNGCENPLHYHPNCSEVLVVAQGTVEHTAADGTSVVVVRPGYVWRAPDEDVLIAKAIVEEES